MHATVAVRGQLAGSAGNAGAAEVLDALHQTGVQYLEGGLDEELLHERVADLHARALGWAALTERLGGQHRHPTDAIAAGARAVQDNEIADALRAREVNILMPHRTDAQRIHQGITGVARVEDDLTADIRQAQAVAVAADAGDDAGEHAAGIRGVGRAEPERVHHSKVSGAHREDVAHDSADAGSGPLVGLDIGRVIMALDLEGDGPAVTNIDDASILADTDEENIGLRLLLAELREVHLARLVGAVLAPHD